MNFLNVNFFRNYKGEVYFLFLRWATLKNLDDVFSWIFPLFSNFEIVFKLNHEMRRKRQTTLYSRNCIFLFTLNNFVERLKILFEIHVNLL